MPFKWDAESERKLLLYIVKHCDVRPGIEAFNGVAAVLGEGVNSNACNQKFYKLKRESEQLLAKAGIETPATPSTKKTTAAKTKATPKSTGKGRKRKTDAEGNDEEDANETPSRKAKKEVEEDVEEGNGVAERESDDQI